MAGEQYEIYESGTAAALAEAQLALLDSKADKTGTYSTLMAGGTTPDSITDAMLVQTGGVLSEIPPIKAEITAIDGTILPPPFEFGARYVSNGEEMFAQNNMRISFVRGSYLSLKQGDTIKKVGATISYFIGGYSTDGGTSFTSISAQFGTYSVPIDGIYFLCLIKPNDAAFDESDVKNGWSYISITRPTSAFGSLESSIGAADDSITDIKTAIGYEVEDITPTDFYVLPNVGMDLNSRGQLIESASTATIDTSGFIPINGLYGVCRVVTNLTKFPLGGIYYYSSDSEGSYISRAFPGANYDFSIYNGENVVWIPIDRTVAGAKYIRFTSDNNRGFKFWVVDSGPQAGVLDGYAKQPFLGKKIVNFGDSIFGLTRPPKDVSSYLAAKTGATVYNAGFGGCEMTTHADSNYNPFSMCNLASAVASGDWSSQEAAAAASGMPAYFAETVAMLEAIDFNTVDIVTIAYGTNDWNNSSPLDNGGNANMAYFADALRYSIETLLTAYPNLRIFVCTQTYRFWMDSQGQFTDDSNTKVNPTTNLKLTDFVAKTIEVAKEYQLPHIDNYDIGMNRYNRSYYFYSTDGTHPKPEGNQLIADNIANKIY